MYLTDKDALKVEEANDTGFDFTTVNRRLLKAKSYFSFYCKLQ